MGKKLTLEDAKNYALSVGSELLTDKWDGTDKKYNFKCTNCGEVMEKVFSIFKQGHTLCKECGYKKASKSKTRTHEQYLQDLINSKCKAVPIESFINVMTPIFHKCPNCGNENWKVKPDSLLSGRSKYCPKCSKLKLKTHEEFTKEVFDLVNNEYEIVNEYKGSLNPIYIKHNICGNIYKLNKAGNFLEGKRCPYCKSSHGENKLLEIFTKHQIKFIKEYTFDNLIGLGGRLLRFDFAIFYKNKLSCLIEYQGEQHYKHISKWMTKEEYECLIKHDNLKRKYCQDNNIKLIEVPYWQYDNLENYIMKLI